MIDQDFWQGKRVFLTGHTGFKGSWLSLWLTSLGATVKGYALNPPTTPSLFNEAKVDSLIDSQIADIRDQDVLYESMTKFNPDILIHMAAQPLVRYSYEAPIETYEVNVIGTAKVLEVARSCPNLKAIINITTDKCYENDGRSEGYKENDPMGGYDPYSSSKGCAELVASAYRNSFFNPAKYNEHRVGLASARAGNVIGGGDWADDRLIPDILLAISDGRPVVIRSPNAIRPWQHVLEPLSGYLQLVQKLYEEGAAFAEGWNFGPNDEDAKPVQWIVEQLTEKWGEDASWKSDNTDHPHEANYLKLDCSKAKMQLDWQPRWSLTHTLEMIIAWQRAYMMKEDMKAKTLEQIGAYIRTGGNGGSFCKPHSDKTT